MPEKGLRMRTSQVLENLRSAVFKTLGKQDFQGVSSK